MFYHLTPAANRKTILRHGLNPLRARGRLRVVWLCEGYLLGWAAAHVAEHHGITPAGLICLALRIPFSWTRIRRPGIYTCARLIPPGHIKTALPWEAPSNG